MQDDDGRSLGRPLVGIKNAAGHCIRHLEVASKLVLRYPKRETVDILMINYIDAGME